jgi:hypothetical protein
MYGVCGRVEYLYEYISELVGVDEEMRDDEEETGMTDEEWKAQQMEEKMRTNRDDWEMKGHQRK